MTLPVADFLQRWLLHVPAPQTRAVRCYRLYHHAHAEGLARCRVVLGQLPVEPRRDLTGRPRVPNGVRPTQNNARPVGNVWCARASFRAAALPLCGGWGRVQPKDDLAGRRWPRGVCLTSTAWGAGVV